MTAATPTPTPKPNLTTLAVVGAIVAVLAILAGAILLVSGDAQLEKLGILAAAVGLVLPGLVSLVRADQAATATNGTLHASNQLAEAFRAELPASVATAVIQAQANTGPPA